MNKSKYSDLRPIKRSSLRLCVGKAYYTFGRYLLWHTNKFSFTKEYIYKGLPYLQFAHSSTLLRQLKDVDMQYQYNKIINLKIASSTVNGIVLHPGETFSYWKLIGRPTYKKGYSDGMVLENGKVTSGVGGGLCQLSNLIYWMTLHTPLKVIERHRHGYDVFPDSNRTQPFGSGATCVFPYVDLMIYNDTDTDYQLCIKVGKENLEGQWRTNKTPIYQYKIIEKNHMMKSEYWGGFSRHNELYRIITDMNNIIINEEFITENNALMMYSPFLTNTQNDD